MKKVINIFLIVPIVTVFILSFIGTSLCEEEKEYREMFVEDQPSISYIGVKYLNGFWDVDGWEHIAERPQWGSYRVFGKAGFYKNLFALYGSFEIGEYQRESISGTDNIRVLQTPGSAGIRKTSYLTWSEDLREEYHLGLSLNLYKLLGRIGMNLEPWLTEEKNEFENFSLGLFVGYKLLYLRYDRKLDSDNITVAGFSGADKARVMQVVENRLPWYRETDIMKDGGGVLDVKVTGAEFGISGRTKRKKGCNIYFRFAFQPAMKAKYHGNSNHTTIKLDEESGYWYVKKKEFNAVSGKLWGYQGEVGVSYNMNSLLSKIPVDFMKKINLIASLGYSFDEITGKELWRDQTFHGITLGLTYAFKHSW